MLKKKNTGKNRLEILSVESLFCQYENTLSRKYVQKQSLDI